MNYTAPAPVLQYADHPTGSRLIVQRDADGGLVITDPPTGVWEQVKVFALWLGVNFALWATLVVFFAWWFGLSFNTVRRLLRTTSFASVPWHVPAQLLLGMLIVVLCALAGTWSRTYRVRSGSLEIETTRTWPRRRTDRREFAGEAIGRIHASRIRGGITLISRQEKRLIQLMVARRADARWLARVLAHELRLEE